MGKTLGADASGEDMILLNHFFYRKLCITDLQKKCNMPWSNHTFFYHLILKCLKNWRTDEQEIQIKNSLNWTALFVSRELVSLKQHWLAFCLPWELLYSNETLEQ